MDMPTLKSLRTHSGRSEVDIGSGHRLFVRDWGKGVPVLFLAGWAMDSRLWGETMVALSHAGFRTIAYDRRGHGRSTDPGFYTYDALADDLAEVIDQLEVPSVAVVAHSGAGGEAIRYMTRYQDHRISHLVLVGATGPCMMQKLDNPDGIPAPLIEGVVTRIERDLDAWLDENTIPFAPTASPRILAWLQGMVLDCSREAIIEFQREIATSDFRQPVTQIRIPVTIIAGDRDVSAPIDLTARRYAALIEQSDLVVMRGAPHGMMVTHCRDLVSHLVTALRVK
ncbi:MAG: alpha/beta fold hydrolase [Sphingomonas sp.]